MKIKKILVGSSGSGKTKFILDNKKEFDNAGTVIVAASDEYRKFSEAKILIVNPTSIAHITMQSFKAICDDIHNIKQLIVDDYEQIVKWISCFNDLVLDVMDNDTANILIINQNLKYLSPIFNIRCRHNELIFDFDQISIKTARGPQFINIESLDYKALDKTRKIESKSNYR